MIVIGVDVHKQSVTAVAVDEAGRMLDERTVPVGSKELLVWADGLDRERLWALEDCRQLTRWLERQLLSVGEELVRVPPKLTVPERRAGRERGKSDPMAINSRPPSPASNARTVAGLTRTTSQQRSSRISSSSLTCPE
ncbi:MAG TPA: hypothetical protein VFJ24_12615, partial [Gaiellales bacterium]|nr:hypothetical protein [Gaiellales bacterium]